MVSKERHEENVVVVTAITKLQARIASLESDLADARQNARTWQPIETAPRDQRSILGCNINSGLMHVCFRDRLDQENAWKILNSTYCWCPTHWQPLPSPPEVRTASSPQSGPMTELALPTLRD